MKKIILTSFLVFLLTACDGPVPFCEREYEPVECTKTARTTFDHNPETFKICMDALSKARSSNGGNYTTHDDEDLDSAIKQCRYAADNIRNHPVTVCVANPRLVAQQKHCNKKKDMFDEAVQRLTDSVSGAN